MKAASGNTMFQIGSISKTFTGTIVMMLVEKGKLDLDKGINAELHESDQFSMDAMASKNIIKLVPCTTPRTDIIVCGPRVGLTLKKTDEFKPKFIMSPYRHYVFPDLIKKQKVLTMLQALESKMDDVPIIFGVHETKVLDLMAKLEAAKKEEQFIYFFEGKQLRANDLINLFAMVHA